MELAQKVLRAVRSLRADYQLVPRQQTHPHIVCSDEATSEVSTTHSPASPGLQLSHSLSLLQLLRPFLHDTIAVLSNSSAVTAHVGGVDLPAGCVLATVTGQVSVHLPLAGLIDPQKEAGRLSAAQKKLQDQLGRLRKELARPDYADKVPQSVQEANAAKLSDGEAELARLGAALASLRLMGACGAEWRLLSPREDLPRLLAVRLAAACAGVTLRREAAESVRLEGPNGAVLSEPAAMAEALAVGGALRGGPGAEGRALVTQWGSWAVHGLWPQVAKALRSGGKVRPEGLALLEAHLAGRRFAAGEALSLADLLLFGAVAPLWRFVLSPKERAAFPGVHAWSAGLVRLPAVTAEMTEEERNTWL